MNYITSEDMREHFAKMPMGFIEWANENFDLHKSDPDYLILTKKEQKAYTARIQHSGFDITLAMLYLSACCYPNVPSRKAILRQMWMRFGDNPRAVELLPFIDRIGSDLYQNINGLKQKICLVK